MQAVAETRHYIKQAQKLLSMPERDAVITMIASDPTAGDIIQGTGGVRKIRFAKEGKGKSGGVRIIYYYYDASIPILLLDLFGKNEKANLSKAERNAMMEMVSRIKQKAKGMKS
jgi:hypothetical protein